MNYQPKTDNWIDIFDYVVDASLGYHDISSEDLEAIQRRLYTSEAGGGDLSPLWGNDEFWDALEMVETSA